MVPRQVMTEHREESASQSEGNTQLRGHQLVLARAVWILIVVPAITITLSAIPLNYSQYLTVCTQSLCPNQLATPALVRALNSSGLSLQFYAFYLTALASLAVFIFCATGVVIAWRKSRDWMALLVSLFLIVEGITIFTDYQQLSTVYPIVLLIGNLLQFLSVTLLLLIGYLFPDGRFVPGWTRWLALLGVFFAGLGTLFPSSFFNNSNWPGALGTVLQFLMLGTALFAQFYRYFRVSDPIQRQQTKWIVLGILVTFIYFIALIIMSTLNPALTQAKSLASLFAESSYFIAVLIIPLSITFSILRYRLWEIDLFINRALVYSMLTGILALIYFGCVLLLQNLVRGLTGQAGQTPLSIVGSTLAIVVLFQPLRNRIQALIDRRFYRRKYDAARTVASFSATLRNEVDLKQLSEHLITVVHETIQPAHVSLWLRPPEDDGTRQAPWRANPPVSPDVISKK